MFRLEIGPNRVCVSRTVNLFFLVLLADPWHSVSSAGDSELDTLLAALRQFDEQPTILRWRCRSTNGIVGQPAAMTVEAAQFSAKPHFFVSARVLFDVQRERYLVDDAETTTPWIDGSAPYYSERTSASYDGTNYRLCELGAPGTDRPKFMHEGGTTPATGSVNNLDTRRPRFSEQYPPLGLGCFQPFVTMLDVGRYERLTSAIVERRKSSDKVRIVPSTDGTETVVVELPRKENSGTVRIYLDRQRDFYPIQIEWLENGKLWQRMIVELTRFKGERFVPVKSLVMNVLDRTATLIEFSDVEINPAVTDADFRVRFPVGTNVHDHVENLFYIIGKGPDAEAKEVREFAQKMALASSPQESRHPLRMVLALVAALAVAVVLVVCWRKFRGTNIWLVAACLVGIGGVGFPNLAQAEVTVTDGVWQARYATDETQTISQCGFHVTVFALEVFHRNYDPKLVSEALRPRRDGVAMSDIANVLGAHGLTVHGRKQLRAADVSQGLKVRQMAIIPIPLPEGRSHYLAAIRNADGRALIADPPRKVAEFADVFRDEEPQPQFVALFVSHAVDRRANQELAEKLSIDPTEIDLGRIERGAETSGDEAKATVRIANPTGEAVAVWLTKSCGCAALSWKGGLLPARGEQAVDVHVRTQTWGEGPHREFIRFDFPDGSSRQVFIRGEVVHSGAPKSAVAHKHVLFEIPPAKEDQSYTAKQTVRLDRVDTSGEGRFECHSAADWLTANVVREAEAVFLNLQINLSADDLESLATEGRRRQTRVDVVYPGDAKVVAIEVAAIALPLAESSPRVVRVSRKGSPQSRVTVMLRDPADGPLAVGRLWSIPEGLTLDVVAGQASDASVMVSCALPTENSLVPRSFVGYCAVESRSRKRDVVSFVVLVDDKPVVPTNN